MRWYYKLLIGLGFATVGYIIGNIIPLEFLRPIVVSSEIKSADYYQIIIGTISAFVTFIAVIIALFKEDIRKFWEYSKICVSIPNESFVEVLKTNTSDTPNDSMFLESEKYNCKIQVKNSGNISALGVEMYLESLTYSCVDYPTPQEIVTTGSPIIWNQSNESRINLQPEGSKRICIFELLAPSSQSSPSGSNTNIPATLIIAGIQINSEQRRGKWIGTFAIFTSNSKPVRFRLEIDWNGRWEKRVTEMRNNLTINLIN